MTQRLALFDLDHTLLPIDTDRHWVDFLARNGWGGDPKVVQAKNHELMEKYTAGTLKIEESVEFMLSFLNLHTPYELARFHEQYMHEVVRPAMHDTAVALVAKHLEQGDLCCLVSATNEFVIAPVARAFGIPHVIGTVPEYKNGRYTGKVVGTPSYQDGKIVRVNEWLGNMGLTLEHFTESWFYSDSQNDIPLLEAVTHPVATNPVPPLRELANKKGWPVLDLFPLQ